jgi:3-hydroxybutyrate dehydrogenase
MFLYRASSVVCRVSCVAGSGFVLTPLIQAQIDNRARDLGVSAEEAVDSLLAEKQPSRTFAKPSDIGELAAFLCSSAANQITGTP